MKVMILTTFCVSERRKLINMLKKSIYSSKCVRAILENLRLTQAIHVKKMTRSVLMCGCGGKSDEKKAALIKSVLRLADCSIDSSENANYDENNDCVPWEADDCGSICVSQYYVASKVSKGMPSMQWKVTDILSVLLMCGKRLNDTWYNK